jgi:glycosyltransferase involved in cell wall biosynthesis
LTIPKVHILTIHPTHYHEYFFKALAREKDLLLQVHYLEAVLSNYPWKTEMRQGYDSRLCTPFFGIDFKLLGLIWKDKKALFFVAGWENSVKISTLLLCMLLGRKFVVVTDTPNLTVERKGIKQFLRRKWIGLISKTCFKFVATGKPGVAGLQAMGVSPSKTDSLPFFVDLDFFKPIQHKLNANRLLFSSGRLVNTHKGFDQVIKVLGDIKRQTNLSFTYKIAGQGPDKAILEALIKENNVEQEVQLLGWKEPNEILELYQTCDIFLHPSHFDPFPNAVLEAMASGAFTIASDAAGSAKDRIQKDVNGLLFPDADLSALYENVHWALSPENDAQMLSMKQQARLTAQVYPVSEGVNLLKKYAFA